ncbi:MAG: gliding motility-associated C-terminal domain-containing protein, partial [Bacteroidetes bacterium]|nr:gliding motility-associated C-terminal domain-containing protein [Bacteroidota bacterium]
SIITPNNDGVNDAFVIPCLANIDRYPNSTVSIFNQWGDEVFHAEPYLSDWEGTFDGEDLPASTYFYIIDLGNGEKPMSGYLIIQR